MKRNMFVFTMVMVLVVLVVGSAQAERQQVVGCAAGMAWVAFDDEPIGMVTIEFSQAFDNAPAVVVTPRQTMNRLTWQAEADANSVTITGRTEDASSLRENTQINWIACPVTDYDEMKIHAPEELYLPILLDHESAEK
jgi:hypothetical protein